MKMHPAVILVSTQVRWTRVYPHSMWCNMFALSNAVDLGRIDFRNKATQSSRRLSVSVKVPARNDLIQAGTGNDVSCIQESLLVSVHIRWGIQTWG